MKPVSDNHKKTYDRPMLLEYGSLGEITQAIGNMGANADGGSMSTQKTA